MAKIMDAKARKIGHLDRIGPSVRDRHERLEGVRVRHQPWAVFEAKQVFDDVDSRLRQGHVTRLASLGCRYEPRATGQIHILPLGVQQLALTGTCQEEQSNNVLKLRVVGHDAGFTQT